MSSSSGVSESRVDSSSTNYPVISHPSARSTASNRRSTDCKIVDIIQMCLIGIAFAATASIFELSFTAVLLCAVAGLSLLPIVKLIINHLGQRRQKSIVVPMSRDTALALLNLSSEEASDIDFLNKRYQKCRKQASPKKELGPSPLKAKVEQLQQDIDNAYRVLQSNHSRQT